MEARTNAVIELAQGAWDDYVFPEGTTIEDSDGWGPYEAPFIGDVQVSRVFYVENENPDEDSLKCYFSAIVDSEAMTLKDAYATDSQGNDFGSKGPSAAAAP